MFLCILQRCEWNELQQFEWLQRARCKRTHHYACSGVAAAQTHTHTCVTNGVASCLCDILVVVYKQNEIQGLGPHVESWFREACHALTWRVVILQPHLYVCGCVSMYENELQQQDSCCATNCKALAEARSRLQVPLQCSSRLECSRDEPCRVPPPCPWTCTWIFNLSYLRVLAYLRTFILAYINIIYTYNGVEVCVYVAICRRAATAVEASLTSNTFRAASTICVCSWLLLP